MDRRSLLKGVLACSLVPFLPPAARQLPSADAATLEAGTLAEYDAAIQGYMRRTGCPGASLAVIRDGLLVHSAAYGSADRAGGPATTATRWRVASLSKMWTASLVRELVAQRVISYDLPVYDALDITPPWPIDPRLRRVTVRHLLDHQGGWDSAASGDPMFRSRDIARALGVPSAPSMWQTAYFVFSQRLDFTPGTRTAYSNFGYGLLGLLIARVTGKPYERAVRDALFSPRGIWGMSLGSTRRREWDEADYRMPAGAGMAWSVLDEAPGWVEWPYGGFALEPMAAHGGWVSSAVDLARYARSLDERRHDALPRPEADPVPTRPGYAYWYANIGSLPGSYSIIRRDWDGAHYTAACAVFNQRTGDGALDASISDDLGAARAALTRWPRGVEA